jgi:small conductance mechanosensitive channel
MGVQSLADSAVVLRITATIKEANIFRAQRLMNREYKLAIDAAGIEIPFPQVVVHNAKK